MHIFFSSDSLEKNAINAKLNVNLFTIHIKKHIRIYYFVIKKLIRNPSEKYLFYNLKRIE